MNSRPVKTLVLGGVKSGKSRYAEALVHSAVETLVTENQSTPSVCVIATAVALDDEMKHRIARHKADRPDHWQTYEVPIYLGKQIRDLHRTDVILIDCLTLWLTNLLMREDKAFMQAQIEDLLDALRECTSRLIIVSNETNMGIVPLGEISRRYCDAVGLLHQQLGTLCERVELIVAGLPLNVKPGA